MYQIPSSAMRTGALCSGSSVAKCRSIVWKPSSSSTNAAGPTVTMTDSPMAEDTEYRPPTQSQNSNMLSAEMPNSATFSAAVDTATKCEAMASSEPRASTKWRRAACALAMVSWVVNVLEATTTRVVAGSISASTAERSAGSTLET